MNALGIIPARYASTRLPGKPLADIGGKSMIQRVYEQASKTLPHVVVATDDERILKAVEKFGGKAVMTSALHRSGTDRCKEALEIMEQQLSMPIHIVINIQGDEPFLNPAHLSLLVQSFHDDTTTEIATLATPLKKNDDLFNPNYVKVVHNKHKQALYFSRSPIPYVRNHNREEWLSHHCFLKHIGIYAYQSHILKKIAALPPTPLEKAESLEQNRWLENGFVIKIECVDDEGLSVDTPEDLEKARRQCR